MTEYKTISLYKIEEEVLYYSKDGGIFGFKNAGNGVGWKHTYGNYTITVFKWHGITLFDRDTWKFRRLVLFISGISLLVLLPSILLIAHKLVRGRSEV